MDPSARPGDQGARSGGGEQKDETRRWDEMALVGRVARAHGIRGQVIVNADSDFLEERFHPGAELFMKRANGAMEVVTLTTVRFHKERPVIGIRGVDDMNAAIALAGAELRVPIERLAELPEGTFYRHDLVGCRVETGDGAVVGTVADVEGSLTKSRLVVKTERGEVLIPLAVEICTTIDPSGKRIVIDPPAGLLEVNE
jgi:16S rRNA processing protein RimM